MTAHLAADATGPGPVGHGFDAASVAADRSYYTFAIAPGVTGIALDSTNRAGFVHGSLGTAQLRWLDTTLKAGTSAYYDEAGNKVTHPADDTYFVLFSHHTSRTMDNSLRTEVRHLGPEIVALVQRYPTVLAWVNGHTHSNGITAHPGPVPRAASGRSTLPPTSNFHKRRGSSRSATTGMARSRCSPRSSSPRRRTRRRTPMKARPRSARCTASSRSTFRTTRRITGVRRAIRTPSFCSRTPSPERTGSSPNGP